MNAQKKNLISQYNQSGNVLVITNYPPRGEGIHTAKIGGVAGFAKNTLLPLAKKLDREDRKIVVLADRLPNSPQGSHGFASSACHPHSSYEEDRMLIIREWKRNSFSLYKNLFNLIRKFHNIDTVLFEFEFASYGDFWITALLPAFFLALKLFGKHTTIVLHQVVTDISSLLGHIGITFGTKQYWIFARILPIYYWLLTHLTDQTVVLEEVFRKRLRGIAPSKHIAVIPHGVETIDKKLSQQKSRERLGLDPHEFIILSFGFITWYKGTDRLLEGLAKPFMVGNKPGRLLIAGGPSATQKEKTHYKNYFARIEKLAQKKNHITMADYIPAEKIDDYFTAADIVVFPYRTVMSSSGPLSLALAYKKPILLSQTMHDYLDSDDIKKALQEAHVSKKSILMPSDISRLPAHIQSLVQSHSLVRLHMFSKLMTEHRSFTKLSNFYYTLLTKQVRALSYTLKTAWV